MRSLLFLSLFLAPALCCGEIMEWAYAFNAGSAANSTFTSVETPLSGSASNSHAFACGHFRSDLSLPSWTPALKAKGLSDGVVVRFNEGSASDIWNITWAAQAFSDNNVYLTDLAIREEPNIIYVSGAYADAVYFGEEAFLPAPSSGKPEGFVAQLDADTGKWLSAFSISSRLPTSLAIDSAGNSYLTGKEMLAVKFDPFGQLIWEQPPLQNAVTNAHIATLEGKFGYASSYILGTIKKGEDDTDVILAHVDADGSIHWVKLTGSPGNEFAGGLGISRQGLISFSVQSAHPSVAYEGVTLNKNPIYPVQQTFLVRTDLQGSPLWATPLLEPGSTKFRMRSSDLAHDPQGNVHVAIDFTEKFVFDGQTYSTLINSGILTVGDNGVPYLFQYSTGSSTPFANAIAAPLRERQILVGFHEDGNELVFGSDTLAAGSNKKAFAAFTRKMPGQSCYLIRQRSSDTTNPNVFLDNLREILQQGPNANPQLTTSAAIYREFNYPDLTTDTTNGLTLGIVGYAAFLSGQDYEILKASELFIIEPDPEIQPSGTLSPAPSNLALLNSPSASAPYSFTYPELCQPIRLYLIDTAVKDPGGNYFASNPSLTILDPIANGYGELVRATGETNSIVSSEHGTNILSLVAGPLHGVAPATPITAKVYDIYPAQASARATALYQALLDAREDRLAPENYFKPSLFLITSNTIDAVSPASIPALGVILNTYKNDKIPIVISAGNEASPASDHAPSLFGYHSNILCVGASRTDGSFYSALSNYGPEVHALAPGQQTLVASELNGNLTDKYFDGTSASAAMAAGSLIQFYAANPWLYGDDLLDLFLNNSVHSPAVNFESNTYSPIKAGEMQSDCYLDFAQWAAWFQLSGAAQTDNDDGDAFSNLEEYAYGFNPRQAEPLSTSFGIESYSSPTLTMGFPIASWLWDENELGPVYLLRDNLTSISISTSADLVSFDPDSFFLTIQGDCDGQLFLTFPFDVSTPERQFFRLECTNL